MADWVACDWILRKIHQHILHPQIDRPRYNCFQISDFNRRVSLWGEIKIVKCNSEKEIERLVLEKMKNNSVIFQFVYEIVKDESV